MSGLNAAASQLYIRDVLHEVFRDLSSSAKEHAAFTSLVFMEVADDSDWHRTRKGYARCEKACVLKGKTHDFLFAFCVNGGGYPAAWYDSDLTSIPLPQVYCASEFPGRLKGAVYHQHSLIVGHATGSLAMGDCDPRLAERMWEALSPTISAHIAAPFRAKEGVLHLDGRPVVEQPLTYRPEFVRFLSTLLRNVLELT